jgi:hypothetical protein
MIPIATLHFHKNHFPDVGKMVEYNYLETRHE